MSNRPEIICTAANANVSNIAPAIAKPLIGGSAGESQASCSGPEAARRYSMECESAISGHDGQKQLFKVACAIVCHFKLPLLTAWKLLLEFNERCKPRWSKAELVHKVVDAFKFVDVHYVEADLMASLPFGIPMTSGDDNFINTPAASATPIQRTKPSRTGYGPGTEEQLQRLASLRGISVEGLRWAQDRGVLIFGTFAGQQVYGVTDQTGSLLEIRRLDGKLFPAVGTLNERKSHAVRGSSKRHPVGIFEANDFQNIIITEGVPDFLAAHDLILRAQSSVATPLCAPVALLSANVAIDESALPIFKGKFVRIFYHNDVSGAGWKGARRWQQQIVKAGAFMCDFFHFKEVSTVAVKDLNEFVVALDSGHIYSDQNTLLNFCS